MDWSKNCFNKRFKPIPVLIPKKPKLSKELRVQETLFGDVEALTWAQTLTELNARMSKMQTTDSKMDEGQMKSLGISAPRTPTKEEILEIYQDVSKLGDIERYLNILYTPFYCTGITSCKFDLLDLQLLMNNSAYDPERQLCVLVKRINPVSNLKIYPNGNIYCQGYSRDSARKGMINMLRELRDMGYNPRLRRMKYNVINASFSVHFSVNLQQLHSQYPQISEYDPFNLPYLSYIMAGTQVKLVIFPTGFVFVMAATSRGTAKLAISHILPILYTFKDSELESCKRNLSRGDIDYKVLWERFFQMENDLRVQW
ncbi:TATA-box-binding protein [Drosophila ficusphila]|uniref:TATA-box-binding protein n=1 Tax=Drosophila ficusphila TaxID=30025 RepID=UPI0007E66040|nr:TATA-box-binding protein [Drosophila ficusphila]